ncbi:MAG TPA: hypothetical protein VM580_06755 [Labilithrix sp.]|nr:hypothetical protein [Labilithrix sp.]
MVTLAVNTTSLPDVAGFGDDSSEVVVVNGLTFPITCQSQHVQWALVREGVGIGIMLAEVGEADPGVRRVMKSLPPIMIPMWLVAHRDVHTSRRVRVVADLLAEGLRR